MMIHSPSMHALSRDLEVECQADGEKFVFTLTTDQPALHRVLQLLETLITVTQTLERQVRRTQTEIKAEAIIQQDHSLRVAIVKMYEALRKHGVKHRAAVDLISKSPLALQAHYGKTEIGWAVKAYQTEMRTL